MKSKGLIPIDTPLLVFVGLHLSRKYLTKHQDETLDKGHHFSGVPDSLGSVTIELPGFR